MLTYEQSWHRGRSKGLVIKLARPENSAETLDSAHADDSCAIIFPTARACSGVFAPLHGGRARIETADLGAVGCKLIANYSKTLRKFGVFSTR